MDNDSSQEKTEEPTSKRLEDAKSKGQTARSKDFNNFMLLMGCGLLFIFIGKKIATNIVDETRKILSFNYSIVKYPETIIKISFNFLENIFYSILPIYLSIMFVSLISPIIIGGWNFAIESLSPKYSRIDIVKGLSRMFSAKAFMEVVKSILKFSVVATVAILVWYFHTNDFLTLSYLPYDLSITKGIYLVAISFLLIASSLLIIAAIDVPFQLHEHNKQLKMTKQEVKDEYKNTEGKPEVKSRIRRVQHEMAHRRMMQEVPKADVILTNPTHYSVALYYDTSNNNAPVVIAKGKDLIAINIGKLGRKHNIPLLRLPPLTRAIYFSTKIDQQIPKGLYIAVAQVLAYIYQLKQGKYEFEATPSVLEDLVIPEHLTVEAD